MNMMSDDCGCVCVCDFYVAQTWHDNMTKKDAPIVEQCDDDEQGLCLSTNCI
jgi:hypothetical protein